MAIFIIRKKFSFIGLEIIRLYHFASLKFYVHGTSLVVQWLRLSTPKAGGPGLIPGQGTRKIPYAIAKTKHSKTF